MYFLRRLTLVALAFTCLAFAVRADEPVQGEVPVEEVPMEEGAPAQPAPAAETPAPAPAPAAEAPAPEAPAAEAATGDTYLIQKGDTLWDLAARYYQDPFKWGAIWEANRDAIRNPHLIYPDQQLRIPSGDGAVASAPAEEAPAEPAEPAAEAPEPAGEEVQAAAPAEPVEAAEAPQEAVEEAPASEAVEEAPADEPAQAEAAAEEPQGPAVPKKRPGHRYVATDLGGDNFVVDENWEADGYVLRDEFRKLMIAQDDVVYLNVGAVNGAKPYMRGGIYRRGGKINDPDTRKRLGYIMRRIGTFQLTENVGDQASSAVVTSSKEPIRVGDIVRLENN